MAPSSGHLLLPKAIKVFKYAAAKATSLFRFKPSQQAARLTLEPIPIRTSPHPTHPLALLRQARSQFRQYGTAASRKSSQPVSRPLRSSLPVSRISRSIQHHRYAPFVSPLRPGITGTLGRSTLGGVRSFSHTPISHAEVLSNVSAALRAFWLEGHRAHYAGLDLKTGEKRFARVSTTQDAGIKRMRQAADYNSTRGASIRFRVAPTVTALTGMKGSTESQNLTAEGLLDELSADFARGVQDLAAVFADLQRLSTYGALPIEWETGGWVNVRFPGCDGKQVEGLCDEVGVRRGYVVEDEGWVVDDGEEQKGDKDVRMALLFPCAPSDLCLNNESITDMFAPAIQTQQPTFHIDSPAFSARSMTSADDFEDQSLEGHNIWAEGYESTSGDSVPSMTTAREEKGAGSGYEGVEGIYRFLAECDAAKR
ncbi:hypothetical protein MMC26_004075 [Xylographa opegraphella]|nr:hypothetical protein [Xylographa opegraphella]